MSPGNVTGERVAIDHDEFKRAIEDAEVGDVRQLLGHGLIVNQRLSPDGMSPLEYALALLDKAQPTSDPSRSKRTQVVEAIANATPRPRAFGVLLHEALKEGSEGRLRALLKSDGVWEARDARGQSLLMHAMRMDEDDDGGRVKFLLSHCSALPRRQTLVLLWATRRNDLAIVGALERKNVKLDADLTGDIPDEEIREHELAFWSPGGSALHIAARRSPRIAKRLLEAGVSKNAQDREGRTPLHIAVESGAIAQVADLLEHGADTNIRDRLGKLPIFIAAEAAIRHPEVFRQLTQPLSDDDIASLLHGAVEGRDIRFLDLILTTTRKPDAPSSVGHTALFSIAYWEDFRHRGNALVQCIEILLQHGADPNQTNKDGETPLHYLARRDLRELKELKPLLPRFAGCVGIRDERGQTPLMWCRTPYAAEFLNDLGAPADDRDRSGYFAVDWAALRGDTDLLQWWIAKGRTPSAETKWLGAVMSGRIDEVAEGLASGISANAQDSDGYPALHAASRRLDVALMSFLIESGALVDARDAYGRTALFECLRSASRDKLNARRECVDLLLDKGIDPRDIGGRNAAAIFHYGAWLCDIERLLKACLGSRDHRGKTALMWASELHSHEGVRFLLDAKQSVDDVDEQGATALFWALQAQWDEGLNLGRLTAELLLNARASVNHQDKCGRTPLHVAAGSGNLSAVRLLLEWDADAKISDSDGRTAHFAAARRGDLDSMKLLIESNSDLLTITGKLNELIVAAIGSGWVESVNYLIRLKMNIQN